VKAVLPVGLKAPPARLPSRQNSTEDLRSFQRLMTHAVVRPLAPGDRLQSRWIDGRPMAEVAESFIKPNDRLTAFDRLEIYNRMYWFRLIGCFHEDNPALRALLGERRFEQLARAYLAKYPSRSFTLRNLCSRLEQFVREEPRWTAPRTAFALAVTRFEWAQTVAFDGESRPALTADDIADTAPGRLRLGLQPYLSLLTFDYPVDAYVLAVKQRTALRAEASNAVDSAGPSGGRRKRVVVPRRARTHMAVHRHTNRLYYKRLSLAELRILQALGSGRPLGEAVAAGGRRVRPDQVRDWFATWMKLGWLCQRQKSPKSGSHEKTQ
jgi:Putative DNA-binding domain